MAQYIPNNSSNSNQQSTQDIRSNRNRYVPRGSNPNINQSNRNNNPSNNINNSNQDPLNSNSNSNRRNRRSRRGRGNNNNSDNNRQNDSVPSSARGGRNYGNNTNYPNGNIYNYSRGRGRGRGGGRGSGMRNYGRGGGGQNSSYNNNYQNNSDRSYGNNYNNRQDNNNKNNNENFFERYSRLPKNTQLIVAVKQNKLAEVKKLVQDGANVDTIDRRDPEKRNALTIAVMNENADMIEYLMQSGAEWSHCSHGDTTGRTAMHFAARFSKITSMNILYSLVRDIKMLEYPTLRYAWTPLHLACYYKVFDSAKWLLEKGVNVMAETENGKTAIDFCRKRSSNRSTGEVFKPDPKLTRLVQEYINRLRDNKNNKNIGETGTIQNNNNNNNNGIVDNTINMNLGEGYDVADNNIGPGQQAGKVVAGGQVEPDDYKIDYSDDIGDGMAPGSGPGSVPTGPGNGPTGWVEPTPGGPGVSGPGHNEGMDVMDDNIGDNIANPGVGIKSVSGINDKNIREERQRHYYVQDIATLREMIDRLWESNDILDRENKELKNRIDFLKNKNAVVQKNVENNKLYKM